MAPRGRARNGQGTISPRKLADGTIVYDAWTPELLDPETGKMKRFAKRGHKTEAAAAAWIRGKVRAIENGEAAEQRQGGATVDKVVERWAKSSTLKASTIAGHLQVYRLLAKPIIGPRPIAEIRSTDIDRLFSTLTREKSATYVALLARALGNIWAYAVRDGATKIDAVKDSPWPQKVYQQVRDDKIEKGLREDDTEEGLIKVFTPEQTRTLITHERRKDLRHFWGFVVHTGARRGEACALRWEDVDLDRGVVWLSENHVHAGGKAMTVDTPKSNRRRRIPIPPELVEVLREQEAYLEERRAHFGDAWKECGLVFPTTTFARAEGKSVGQHMDPQAVSDTFLRRTKKLGLPNITLHGLRHTYASALFIQGVDIATIQKLLGHRLVITTFVYVHIDRETLREATTRVVDYLRAA
jgi:integrase